jgi:serine/threonine-protein kinase ULK4
LFILQGLDEFQSTLLRIFEVFSQQSSIPLAHPDVFFHEVLPSLAILYRKKSSGDTRFLCLKTFFDVLVVYLDNIANPPEEDLNKNSNGSASHKDLRMIAREQFLPYYSSLLDDDDPIPMYAQKTLMMLLDIKCIGIEDILGLKLLSQFFDFLRDDFSTVNLHSVRLCLFLASAPEVKTSSLSELGICGKVGALVEFVHGRDMEDFLEPSLSLCKSLLARCSVDEIKDAGEFVSYMNVFLELCCRNEVQVAEVASECLYLLVKVIPKAAAPELALRFSLFRNVLERCSKSQGGKSASTMQERLLLTLSAVCRECRAGQYSNQHTFRHLSGPDASALISIVSRFKNSNVQAVADAASDSLLELQAILGQS